LPTVLRNKSLPKNKNSGLGLSASMMLVALLMVFLWNLQITQSGRNVGSTLSSSVLNLNSVFGNDSRSNEASSALGVAQSAVDQEDVTNYAHEVTKSAKLSNKTTYVNAGDYTPILLPPESISATMLVRPITDFANLVVKFSDVIVKVCLLMGLIILFLRYRKSPDAITKLLAEISFGAAIAIFLFALVPYLSIAYGFGRFYDQTLIVLCVPLVLGLEWLSSRFKPIKLFLVCGLSLIYFSSYFGLRAQIFGGNPSINLNNSGSDYNYYIQDGEVDRINWLVKRNGDKVFYADIYSSLKFESMSSVDLVNINTNVLPSIITKGSYVYLRQTNIQGRGSLRDYDYFHQASVDYAFPNAFLSQNENLVYANRDSDIYR
jgi:uncharacterized membrane protein